MAKAPRRGALDVISYCSNRQSILSVTTHGAVQEVLAISYCTYRR